MKRTLLLCCLMVGAWACRGEDAGPQEGVPGSLETVATEPLALATVASEPVQGRTGPGGTPFEVALRTRGTASHLERRIGARTFALPLRTSGLTLTQYPCTSCHQGAVTSGRRDPDVHQNIQPVHPSGSATACVNCHSRTAVDRLVLEGGETVTLDHAYRLCAQCHFPEADAWAAGSHGKRLDGWRGRRVVMGCADCHDPHRPAPTARTPLPGPRLPESRVALVPSLESPVDIPPGESHR